MMPVIKLMTRNFAYKPTHKLIFKEGKYIVMDNHAV